MLQKNNENIAKGIKREIESFLTDTNQLFVSLANNPIIQSKNIKLTDEIFSKVYRECKFCLNILLADMDGNNIGSAVNPEKAHKLNYSDMDWFKKGSMGKPTINDPHISKLFKEKTFMMTYPVFSGNKQIAVLGIPLNLNKLNSAIMKEYNLTEKTNVIIVNEHGIIMGNLLFPELIGKRVPRKELYDAIFSGKSGTFIQLGIDNLERLFSFETIENYNWKIVVGTPTKKIFEESIKNVQNILYTSIILILITFFIALRIAKGINKKFDTLLMGLDNFGKGELNFRFKTEGIKDEFLHIFSTFNQMAENIEKNNEEIIRLNKIYRLLSEVNQKIVKSFDIQRLLNDITKDIVEIGGYRLCLILKIEKDKIKPLSFYGKDEQTLQIALKEKEKLDYHETISKSVSNRETCISKSSFKREYNFDYNSFLSIPLIIENEVYGVILVFKENDEFNYQEIKLLEELSSDVAFAINNINTVIEKQRIEELIFGMFEAMGEGLALIDKDSKIVMANNKYIEILGKRKEEVINEFCYKVMHNQDSIESAKQYCSAIEVFEDGRERSKILQLKSEKGMPKIVSLKLFPLFKNNLVEYVIEIINDITEIKKLEEQYLHAQKMESIGRFSAGIAHDFNNILTGIIGFATLSQSENDGVKLQKNLQNIIDLSNKASNLTKSLLSFSRKTTPHFEHIDINHLISENTKMLSRIVGEDILIETKLYNHSLIVFADPIQLEQVFMNLASNSKDAMPKGGKIVIEVDKTYIDESFINYHNYGNVGHHALISFSDTGSGIPQELLDKIFEPFFTTKEVGKGTGLGLSVVYGIIKNHDGFINVYSEIGKGTTFKIYLPISQESPNVNIKEQQKVDTHKINIKILLIDDDEQVRDVTKGILKSFGIEVIDTENTDFALEAIEKQNFDLIICDVVMPRKSGIEFYTQLKNKGIKTPILFISGYSADIVSEKYGVELQNIIIKPFTPLTLISKIKSMLNII
ncbi:MAG: ATP-binding protein [Proteobacteria bacterium]|nr:ATP-binding protein [Pseudomonadota bacterium]